MFSRGMIDSPSCAGAYGRDGARPSRGDVGRVVPRHDHSAYGRDGEYGRDGARPSSGAYW